MSLMGDAVVLVWNDVRRDAAEEFLEWHNREHTQERVGIPGFLRSRRFRAMDGRSRYFLLYELADSATLGSEPYMERLNNPTPWTRRMGLCFSNSCRSLCRVPFSRGLGQGGLIYTLSYDLAQEDDGEAHLRLLTEQLLPAVAAETGVIATHLCQADIGLSRVQTEEKKGRVITTPSWVVLVEGSGEPERFLERCEAGLPESIRRAGGGDPIDRGVYALEFSRGKTARS